MRILASRTSCPWFGCNNMTCLLFALLFVVVRADNDDPCGTIPLQNYQACLDEHPCECQNCDYNPMDRDPVITIDHPEDCNDVHNAFCPLVNCCAPCRETNAAFYECAAHVVSTHFTGTACPVDASVCDDFPTDDVTCDANGDPVEMDAAPAPVETEPEPPVDTSTATVDNDRTVDAEVTRSIVLESGAVASLNVQRAAVIVMTLSALLFF